MGIVKRTAGHMLSLGRVCTGVLIDILQGQVVGPGSSVDAKKRCILLTIEFSCFQAV
jgi:hypothetical protein